MLLALNKDDRSSSPPLKTKILMSFKDSIYKKKVFFMNTKRNIILYKLLSPFSFAQGKNKSKRACHGLWRYYVWRAYLKILFVSDNIEKCNYSDIKKIYLFMFNTNLNRVDWNLCKFNSV